MNAATRKGHPSYVTAAEILDNAGFTEDPERLQIERLPANIQADISASARYGFRPVRVSWPCGAVAILLAEPGHLLPFVDQILVAYERSKNVTAIWPEGTLG